MSRSLFRVVGKLDSGGQYQEGTVAVDRIAGTFSVRPLRRRRVYELPLSVVADWVVHRVVQAELREKRAAKKATKKGNR